MNDHVLDGVHDWWQRFIKTTGEHDHDLLTLWLALTYVLDRTRTCPRLIVTSPFPGAGKTTVLEHLHSLGHRPTFASNALSASALANLAREGRTILIDEADKHVGSGNESQRALLGIVNAGYKASGTYAVNVADEREPTGWRVAEVPVFGPVAMAGLSLGLPDDTLSRSLVVRLLPDIAGAVEESDWESIEEEARGLREQLAAWTSKAELCAGETLPDGIVGRLREVWRPLKRVAVAAGGDWPERVDLLACRHRDELAMLRDDGLYRERPHVVLLRDLFGVWHVADRTNSYAPTGALLDALHRHAPEQWGSAQPGGRTPLTAQRMGRMLVDNYGIHASRLRRDGPRGYLWSHFGPAWESLGLIGATGVDGRDVPVAS